MTKGHLAFLAVKGWCETNGYPVPVPEHPFAKSVGRKFPFDIAWVGEKLAMEIQGQIWKKGGHSTGTGITRDCEKLSLAAVLGWRVMPVTYDQLNSGQVFKWLESIFTEGR